MPHSRVAWTTFSFPSTIRSWSDSLGVLNRTGEVAPKTLAGGSACPTKMLILRCGAGASACQRSAKDDQSPFRLRTRLAVPTHAPTLIRLAWQRRQYGSDLAPALILDGLHVLDQLLRQIGLQLWTARLAAQHPAHRGQRLRDFLHLLVIDLVGSVRGTVIIRVQPGGKKDDRDSHFREVVMIAAVEDALPIGLRTEIIVSRVGSGHIVEMVQNQLQVSAVHRLDGLLQIVAADVRSH